MHRQPDVRPQPELNPAHRQPFLVAARAEHGGEKKNNQRQRAVDQAERGRADIPAQRRHRAEERRQRDRHVPALEDIGTVVGQIKHPGHAGGNGGGNAPFNVCAIDNHGVTPRSIPK